MIAERAGGPERQRTQEISTDDIGLSIGALISARGMGQYASRGNDPTPTKYFDPTASGSSGAGTFANPYRTIAQVVAGFTGAQAGNSLGIKRGTVLRTPSTGFIPLLYGSAQGGYAQIFAYGDAANQPYITGSAVYTTWVQDSGVDSRVWYLTSITQSHAIFYANTRIEMKSSYAAMQSAGAGYGYFDSGASRLYFIPIDGLSPNLGQTEVTVSDYCMRVNYSNVSASGWIAVHDIAFGHSRNSALLLDGPDAGTGSVSSLGPIAITGCSWNGCGADGNATAAAACGVYGKSDSVRFSAFTFAGNVGDDVINNAVEYGATSKSLIEGNYFTRCGGNSIAELWYSNSSAVVRYNRGSNVDSSTRVVNSYARSAIWQSIFDTILGTTSDHTKSINNSFYGNLALNSYTTGIRVDGGTGHAIFNNTLLDGANRGINFAAAAGAAGTASAAISNNLVVMTASGNRTGADVMQGTATNGAGFSITATLTGNNNNYYTVNDDMNWRVNNTSMGFNIATYKAAITPMDTACTKVNPFLDNNYHPRYGSAMLNGGTTVAAWVRDADGLPIEGTIGVGCFQLGRQPTGVLPFKG